MFGLVVPGRQLVTNFIRESETSWVCEIPNPREIANFALFFTDELPLDPPIGVSVYCSYVQPFTSWQVNRLLSFVQCIAVCGGAEWGSEERDLHSGMAVDS
eukprot:Gregarina_sp_Poly_1__738@NODE_1177_length_4857_cov_483_461587_g807_i0_p6_GENE_NODE_1177_length_4857_cov_483_461587_g807_i0NODE_1177_length_4857_cov_483_461587_g807_i0_p6_ORF_typecomplete_len101_score8_51DUF775/PF05603_12/1_9e13_NODE_1177_length_4857_cov_483_461587_g807_i029113213